MGSSQIEKMLNVTKTSTDTESKYWDCIVYAAASKETEKDQDISNIPIENSGQEDADIDD